MNSLTLGAALLLALPKAVSAQMGLPEEITDGFYVTVDDVRANSEEVFQAFAGEDGGPISQEEFVTADIPSGVVPDRDDAALLRDLFQVIDANQDGQITHAEWEQSIARDLTFADTDDDGRITLRELANAREEMSFGDAIGMMF